MLKIGKIKISSPLILAPMAGITDMPFRIVCKNFGASLMYTEFVSADGIIRKNQNTLEMIKFSNEERPIGIQIFGDDPLVVSKSAKYINEYFQPDIIDINYGCPVPKVTKRGAGSAALKDLCLMKDITQAVIDSVGSTPVTVKMRLGWNENQIKSTEAGILLEKVGIKAITLHARTTKQLFTGEAKWRYIKELKEAVNIPVIGNGDIINTKSFVEMMEFTKCDAAMIGRGALGKPWIFEQIHKELQGLEYKTPNIEDILDISIKHIKLLIKNKPVKVAINLSKKHLSYYLKGFNEASKFRNKIMTLNSADGILETLYLIKEKYKN